MSPFVTIAEAKRRYKHGTRSRYSLAKCRCTPCRKANRTYENLRSAAKKRRYHLRYAPPTNRWVLRDTLTGAILFRFPKHCKASALCKLDKLNGESRRLNELVPTDFVVKHLETLQQRHGIGVRHASDVANVTRSVLRRILHGKIKRTRRSTAQRILAITLDDVTNKALMTADTTTVLIHRLQAAGYRRSWIAQQLGLSGLALQIGKRDRFITIKTARAVYSLYRNLANADERLTPIATHFTPTLVLPVCGIVNRNLDSRMALHGTNERFESGCRCTDCHDAHRAYNNAIISNGHYRYVLRKRGLIYNVIDKSTGTTSFSHRRRKLAIAVRDASNATDSAASRNVRVPSSTVIRALKHLKAIGFKTPWIAELLGSSLASIQAYQRNPKIRLGQARQILALYHSLEQRVEFLQALKDVA